MADQPPTAAPVAPTAATPAAPEAAPAAPTTAAAPAAEPISTEEASSQIDAIDDWNQLESILDGRKPSEVKAGQPGKQSSETAPKPAQPAAPAQAAAPAAAEPGENEVIEGTGEERLPKNFRIHTEDPQRSRYLKLLRQRPEANPVDLAVEAGYSLPQARQAAAAPVAPAPAVDPLKGLREEIALLQTEKTAARDGYEFGKVDELAEQILEKKLELQRRENEIEAEQVFEQEYRGEYNAAREQAVAKYPETGQPGTPQFDELRRERAFLEQTEPGFFDDPGYPLALLERLETRRPDLFKGGQAPAPAAPVPPVVPPPNATPNNAARPVGIVAAGTEGSHQPLGKEEVSKAIDNMSLEELTALGDQVGTKSKVGRGRVPGVIRG